jgi:YhhN family
VVMCATALAASLASGAWVFGAAALVFAASDIAVARQAFVQPALTNKLWGLPLYYAAQLALAGSVALQVAR